MGTKHNEHDEALVRILEALRTAAPPEGMDGRIAQRLRHAESAQPVTSRWRDLLASLIPSSEWARGAIAGAATALLLAAAVYFSAGHLLRPHDAPAQSAAQPIAPSRAVPVAYPLSSSPAHASTAPCANASRSRELAEIRPSDDPLAAINAPSHPAPALGLTAQERALVRLVQTADPKQLAALDAQIQAKSQSDEDSQFEKFFAPPPAPKPDPQPDQLTASAGAQGPSPSPSTAEPAPAASNNE